LGADLFVHAPVMVFWSAIAGVAGLLGTWLFHRWVQHPKRERLAQWIDDGAAGSSLSRARKILEEMRQFEME